MVAEAVSALDGVLWCAVAALFFYGPWQKVWTDYCRDEVFEQRDKLFDMAASGVIRFDDPAYTATRESLNAIVRLAHCFTFPRLVLSIWVHRENGALNTRTDARRAIARVQNPIARETLERAMRDAEWSVVKMIIVRSPWLAVFLICVGYLLKLFGRLSALRSAILSVVARPIEAAIRDEARQSA